MTQVYLTAIGLLLAALLGVGWFSKSQYDSIHDLRMANKGLVEVIERSDARAKQDRKVLVARQGKIAVQARKLAQVEQALSEALQRNKDWSDTDVPPDVQKALRSGSGGLPADSAGVHDDKVRP